MSFLHVQNLRRVFKYLLEVEFTVSWLESIAQGSNTETFSVPLNGMRVSLPQPLCSSAYPALFSVALQRSGTYII